MFKKKPVENNRLIDLERNLRSYRFLGQEAEVLGTRLDAARESLKNARSVWAQQYWKNAVDQLLFQWRSLPVLHDADAQMSMIPRWSISYDFFDNNTTLGGYDLTDKVFDTIFRTDLTDSWNRVREQRLARAQY